jgi:hypothetical protein
MSQPPKIAERLLVQAELCRKLAGECWNEEIAARLLQLAHQTFEAARVAGDQMSDSVPIAIKRPSPEKIPRH